MPRYACFLRGINVGGHRVKMDHLARLFEMLGFTDVETIINSGNLVFKTAVRDTARLEKRIATHLEKSLGYEVAAFIRSAPELAEIATFQPYPAAELAAPGHSLLVLFLPAALGTEPQQDVARLRTGVDELRAHGREIYWLNRGRISDTKVSNSQLAKATRGATTTARNINTVRRLLLILENQA